MSARLFVPCLALFACGPEAPAASTGSRELAVLGGTNDTTHDAVVSIQTVPDAAVSQLCSGVVVAPRLVVTAGHCVSGLSASDLVVGVGTRASSPLRTLAVASAGTLPSFGTNLTEAQHAGRDLGYVVLAEDAGITPIPFARTLKTGTTRVVGFGASVSSDIDTRGIRRVADVKVVGSCSTQIAFGDTTTNACHGDSGGPLLVDDSGTELVLGVVSWGRTDACDPPSYAMRLDVYADWLDSLASGASTPPCASCGSANDCASLVGGAADAATDASDAEIVDADVDAGRPAPASSSSCMMSGRGHDAATLFAACVILGLFVTRRCSGACSRSSGDRCR